MPLPQYVVICLILHNSSKHFIKPTLSDINLKMIEINSLMFRLRTVIQLFVITSISNENKYLFCYDF